MKKLSLLFCLIFCLPFVLFACGEDEDVLNSYYIDASFDEESMSLSCEEQVCYVNNSDNALNEICFYVYANAFDEGQKAVAISYENKAYPNGRSYGRLDLKSVKIGENDAENIFSENRSILTVKLKEVLFPSESVTVDINFTVYLANIHHRLGYGDNTINFGNFFPIACVYENGFVKNDFCSNGDPFYSDCSNFDVKISYPSRYTIATTGTNETSLNSETKTTTCKARKVRDFCFVLSDKFEVLSAQTGDVQVNYFGYDDKNAQEYLKISVQALETFEELFGEYPYQVLNVVKSNFCYGGMEYPNLVYVSDDLQDDNVYNYCIVHEIAHQWWYGLIGNNEFECAWVDEGLTDFSTAMFFEEHGEYNFNYDTIMANARDTYKNFVDIYTKITGTCDQSMNRTLLEFETEPEYVNCTYTKGMLMFASLRDTLGKRKFSKCLKEYYKDYKFKNSSPEKMIKSFSQTSGVNLESYFSSWIDGAVVIG
ncbi:MAG: M1 family metallopeptidase [Candidatus Caccovivens sp.]